MKPVWINDGKELNVLLRITALLAPCKRDLEANEVTEVNCIEVFWNIDEVTCEEDRRMIK